MASKLVSLARLSRQNSNRRLYSTTGLHSPPGKLNPLKQVIMHEISKGGSPMSLARFMELGLMHPQHGYYSAKETIFNKGGDFTTSPEISQMFGEMVGIWLMTALRNYQSEDELQQSQQALPPLNSINLVEIGPGTGIMMSDILRTLSQFTGNLRNIHVNLVEASANLVGKQQDRLLGDIQNKMNMFLTYDMEQHEKYKNKDTEEESGPTIDRFYNKDQNFSISWYPSLSMYYNTYLEQQVKDLSSFTQEDKQDSDRKAIQQAMMNPCFVLAHELFDALPIHQFQYSQDLQWCERVVKMTQDQQNLELGLSDGPNENVLKVLKPEKLFAKASTSDIKPGDTIEICPGAVQMTQEICSLLELSKGTSLIIDYGEDHAFQNSFRGIKNHKLVKDFQQIVDNIGEIDLTSYVNFAQLSSIAKANKNIITHGPIPQGLFLESMGVRMRLEILQQNAKTQAQKQLLEDSYVRLCSPDEMGATYKMLYLGHKEVGDVYPFIGEETMNKQEYYG